MVKVFISTDALFGCDTYERLFRTLGGDRFLETVETAVAEENRTKAFFRRGVESMNGVRLDDVEQFCRSVELADGFPELVNFCREHGIELVCVGEGLDVCARTVLEQNGAGDVRVVSNRLEELPDAAGRLAVAFPYDDAECTRCSCCTRNVMLTLCGDSDRIVFIGRTAHDACPAEYADVIFARDVLQTRCQERNISYFLYTKLDEVAHRLGQIVKAKRLKVRREAAMKRRAAFIAE